MKHFPLRALCLVLTLLLLALPLVSCKPNEEDDIPEHTQLATLPGCPYRLYIPTGWVPLTDAGMSGGYYSMNDHVTAVVNSYDAPSYSLDSAAEVLRKYINEIHVPALAEVYLQAGFETNAAEPEERILGNEDALMISYTGVRANTEYRGMDTICLHDGRVYVLSCVAKSDIYGDVTDTFLSIAENFKFSDTPCPGESPNTVDTTADAPDGMMLASNNDVAYRFYVPAAWQLDLSQPTSVAYVSEQDRSNVSVTVYLPDSDNMTADSYWEMCEFEIRSALPTMTTPTIAETVLDTRPAFTRTYSAELAGKYYTFAQTYANYRGMFYTVTYTAESDRFEEHLPDYEKILAAFDFRGN